MLTLKDKYDGYDISIIIPWHFRATRRQFPFYFSVVYPKSWRVYLIMLFVNCILNRTGLILSRNLILSLL